MGEDTQLAEPGSLVAGTELVLLAATDLEAEPLLTRFREARKEQVAGKAWYRGRLGGTEPGGPGVDWDVLLVVSGYDKTNTAHALTCVLQARRPRLVLQFGVAGAFPDQGLDVRDLVLASTEIYADTGSSSPEGWLSTETFGLPLAEVGGRVYWNEFPLDGRLVVTAARLLGQVPWGAGAPVVASGPCVTLSQVTGVAEESAALQRRWQALAESMEGAAAAHVCALYQVPFIEVRAVSNLVGDRERGRWDLQGASERAAQAAAALALRGPELMASLELEGPAHEPAAPGGN